MYIIVTSKPEEYTAEPGTGISAVETWNYLFYGRVRSVFTIGEVTAEDARVKIVDADDPGLRQLGPGQVLRRLRRPCRRPGGVGGPHPLRRDRRPAGTRRLSRRTASRARPGLLYPDFRHRFGEGAASGRRPAGPGHPCCSRRQTAAATATSSSAIPTDSKTTID